MEPVVLTYKKCDIDIILLFVWVHRKGSSDEKDDVRILDELCLLLSDKTN
jgi:hypothetical protein